jgi:hypothetical protein
MEYFSNLSYNADDDVDGDGHTNMNTYQVGSNPRDDSNPQIDINNVYGNSFFTIY